VGGDRFSASEHRTCKNIVYTVHRLCYTGNRYNVQTHGRMKETSIGGLSMSGEYRHTNQYEKEILHLRIEKDTENDNKTGSA
jgi:hypothetical protein